MLDDPKVATFNDTLVTMTTLVVNLYCPGEEIVVDGLTYLQMDRWTDKFSSENIYASSLLCTGIIRIIDNHWGKSLIYRAVNLPLLLNRPVNLHTLTGV